MLHKWIATSLLAGAAFTGAAQAETPLHPADQAPKPEKRAKEPTAPTPQADHRAVCYIQSEKEKKNPDAAYQERVAQCLRGADALLLIKEGRVEEAFKILAPSPKN